MANDDRDQETDAQDEAPNAATIATARRARLRDVMARVGVGILLACAVALLEAARVLPREVRAGAFLGAIAALSTAIVVPLIVLAALLPIAIRTERRRLALSVAAGLAAAIATAIGIAQTRFAHHRFACAFAAAVVAALGVALGARAIHALRRRAPAVLGALACTAAIVALIGNQRLYPRLYAELHVALALVAAFALAIAADALVRATTKRRVVLLGAGFAGLLLAVFVLPTLPFAARVVARSEAARRALHEESELLRPVVRQVSRRLAEPATSAEVGADPCEAGPGTGPTIDAAGWNVLLVTIDALRADHVGAYGGARPTTPNLDGLAREGVLFRKAYTPAPQTSYAITSIMTGRPARIALDARSPERAGFAGETWPEILGELGYRTAAFYPETVFFTDRPRFRALEERRVGFAEGNVEYEAAHDRVETAIRFAKSVDQDQRFFAWVHLFEPHEPYEPRAEADFGTRDIDLYDAEIVYVDRTLGRLVSGVRAIHPKTIVIVTADHGEAFGDHGARFHGTTVYEEQVAVPLVIHAPELLAQAVIEEPVQTFDLMPTFARALGATLPKGVRGRDLGDRLVNGKSSNDGLAYAAIPDASMLAIGNERVVCLHAISVCSLFDLAQDPAQLRPISDPARVGPMRSKLEAVTAAHRAAEIELAKGSGSGS